VPPGRLLGIDEIAVDDDLEDAAPRGDEDEVLGGVFELLEDLGRQTDGLVEVASDRAVLDRDLHRVRHPDRPNEAGEAVRTAPWLC